jgi:glycosyltransferase involved in cell wall biosynthesis
MKLFIKGLSYALVTLFVSMPTAAYDVTFVGHAIFSVALWRIPIIFIDMLKDDLKINFIPTDQVNLNDIPTKVQKILASNINGIPGNIAIMFDGLWYKSVSPIHFLPSSKIKIAYSMFEASRIPKEWVQIINNKFDAVVVPDPFLVDAYKNSGVKRPIFAIPLPLYLDDFLNKPCKRGPNKPFVFGSIGNFFPGKNQMKIIDSFAAEFGNSPNVSLRIHGVTGHLYEQLNERVKQLGVNNIQLTLKTLTQAELVELLYSFDCYVLLSKGEGFSMTAREALALGITCILSNNTAHETICKTGFVKAVPCPIFEPADYSFIGLGSGTCGQQFDCKQEDVQRALREVYSNYSFYQDKARQGREWARQYNYRNLKKCYLSLIKPKKIIFGNRNEITDTYLMTKSKTLYRKYKAIFE